MLTVRGFAGRRERSAAAPRVGLFGLLGSGNIGNDASMESVLRYLRADHPDAVVDAMCKGPATVTERYGIVAISLGWYQKYEQRASGVMAIVLKVLGKGVDVFRTARWVRRHDVVIVPGMGVLEATLPLRAMGNAVRNVPGLRVGEALRDESRTGQRGGKRRSTSG